MAYSGYNEAKKKCNERYLSKFVKPTIRMTEEEKKKIEEAANREGKSFNRFIIDCALKESEKLKGEIK